MGGWGRQDSPSGFDRLLRYMSSIERQLNRTINQLRQLQADRRKQGAQPPLKPRTMAAGRSESATCTPDQFVSSDPSTTQLQHHSIRRPQHDSTTQLEHHSIAQLQHCNNEAA